jgi:uncharacterized cupin superfamily protein
LLLALADGSPVEHVRDNPSLGASDPFNRTRQVAYLGADGIAVGVLIGNDTVEETFSPFSETLVVHRGHLSIQSAEQQLDMRVGECVAIGHGTAFRVTLSGDAVVAFCSATDVTGDGNPGLTFIERYADLAPSASLAPPIIVGLPPQCRALTTFEDSASPLRTGVWDSTPYVRNSRPQRVNELMHLIEGRVTLTEDNGNVVQVNTGDTVFVPQGTPCAWTSTGYVRKIYTVT